MINKTKEEIITELSQFTGTESYYKSTFGLLKLTEGMHWLREQLDCYWLIDIIESVQGLKQIKKAGFQVWTLVINPDKSWVVTCKEDTDRPVIYEQEGNWTDFKLDKIEFYCINKVVLLKSEY